MFSGADAAAYGLVTLAVPDDSIDERVAEVCASLATGAHQGCVSRSGSSTPT